MRLLAIDPGNRESAYVIIDQDCRPTYFGKVPNEHLFREAGTVVPHRTRVVIEMVASYGMAVGADVFDTCVWIGRHYERFRIIDAEPELIKRQPVKLHHCHSPRATDSNIRQALVDRFAYGQPNHGKGTKASPGWFHGFHSDIWAAYALAVYAVDTAA